MRRSCRCKAVNWQCPAGGASHPNPADLLTCILVAIDLHWLRSPLTNTIHHSGCLQAHRSTVVVPPSPLLKQARCICLLLCEL